MQTFELRGKNGRWSVVNTANPDPDAVLYACFNLEHGKQMLEYTREIYSRGWEDGRKESHHSDAIPAWPHDKAAAHRKEVAAVLNHLALAVHEARDNASDQWHRISELERVIGAIFGAIK